MKGFVTIVAASAVLSLNLFVGAAAPKTVQSHGLHAGRVQTVAAQVERVRRIADDASAVEAVTPWVDPTAKSNAGCRGAAWPYRLAVCAAADRATGAVAPQS